MNHNLPNDELSAYLDGELTESRRREVEAHLESCEVCSATLAAYKRTSQQVRLTKESPLGESFVFRVRGRIRSGSDEQVSWIPAEKLARRLVFTLALVVIIVGGVFWNRSEPVSGIVEGYYQVTQQDSVLTRLLHADTAPTKDDLLLAVMAK